MDKAIIITIVVITITALAGSEVLMAILKLFSTGNGVLGQLTQCQSGRDGPLRSSPKDYTMSTQHVADRLAERNIVIELWKLNKIAQYFGSVSTAVVLARLDNHVGQDGAYRTRSESNGDLVILIVRDAKPITVMYRRSNQPLLPDALHVKQVVELVS